MASWRLGDRLIVLVAWAGAAAGCARCGGAKAPSTVPDDWVKTEDRATGWEAWAPAPLAPAGVKGAWVYKDGPTVVWKVSVEDLGCRPATPRDEASLLDRRLAKAKKEAKPTRWEPSAPPGPHTAREVDWSDSTLGVSVVRRETIAGTRVYASEVVAVGMLPDFAHAFGESLRVTAKDDPNAPACPDESTQPPTETPLTRLAARLMAECQVSAWGPHYEPCAPLEALDALPLHRADGPAIVAMIEDPHAAYAHTGAKLAARARDLFREDRALQERLLAVGEAAKKDDGPFPLDKPLPQGTWVMGPALAGVVCRFDLAKTGLTDRVERLARARTGDTLLRAGLASCLLPQNPDDARIRALTESLAKDGDEPEQVRRGAAFGLHPTVASAEECKKWLRDIDANDARATVAVSLLFDGHHQGMNPWIEGWPDGSETIRCPLTVVDAALRNVEQRQKDGRLAKEEWFSALAALGEAENLPPEFGQRALAVAKKAYEDPKSAMRGPALRAMAVLDPFAAREAARAHLGDDLAPWAKPALAEIDHRAALAATDRE